ncbi:hypothetical protein CJ030_MR0G027291 [Morella rubra]|uniref:Uncharacterized protein n=1 Tax=Morella rubra TaxID=262757 RepID=A0A6A1UFS7_9ROSI|nr:hypothetical protein CJ030_MR0G027291 [Morella rubra]
MLVEVGNYDYSVPRGIYDHPCGIIFPGDEIPDFFRYYEEHLHVFSCDINVDRQYLRGIMGIFLCVVVNGTSQLRRPAFRMLGRGFRWCGVSRELDLMGSDHVWLEYLELLPYEEWCFKNENEQLDGDPYLRIHIYGIFQTGGGGHSIHIGGMGGSERNDLRLNTTPTESRGGE